MDHGIYLTLNLTKSPTSTTLFFRRKKKRIHQIFKNMEIMGSVYWIFITIVLGAFCSLVFQELQWMMKRRRLPPGPKGLPIIGSLHLLGKNPHQDLFKLSQEHGEMMHMRFGTVPAIIVSSPEAAEKFLKTHDHSFATRPYSEAAWYVTYGQRDLVLAPYGPFWRNMRKLCITELISNQKIISFESTRQIELGKLINSLKKAASGRVTVDLTAAISYMILGLSSVMVFGKNYIEEEIGNRSFKDVILDMSRFAAVPNLGDFFPFLGVFDLQGLRRKYKDLNREIDDFLEKIIQDHVVVEHEHEHQEVKNKDFVDTMMGILESGEADFEFDRRHVKCVILNMFITTSETIATSIQWAMTELVRHPNAMKKLQAEIQEKIGLKRMVEESDLEGLEYLDAVVKETFRLHPAAPLLLPHEAMEDCNVDGFHIERKSRLIINYWAIGHDPNVWPEPNSFNPERFLGSNIDFRGHDFQLIPFGSGRRICPGVQLAGLVFQLVLAQLVHCFNWELPNGMLPSDVDMDETFGFVTQKTEHLSVVPYYRLTA